MSHLPLFSRPQPALTTSFWLPAVTSLETTPLATWLRLMPQLLLVVSFVTWERPSRPRLALTQMALPALVSSALSRSSTQPIAISCSVSLPPLVMQATRAIRPITSPPLWMAALLLMLLVQPPFSPPPMCPTAALCKFFYQSITNPFTKLLLCFVHNHTYNMIIR